MPTETDRLRRIDARRKTVIECQSCVDTAKATLKAAKEALQDAKDGLDREIDESMPLFDGMEEDEHEPVNAAFPLPTSVTLTSKHFDAVEKVGKALRAASH